MIQTGRLTFQVPWVSRRLHPRQLQEEVKAIHRYVLALPSILESILPTFIFFTLCFDLYLSLSLSHPLSISLPLSGCTVSAFRLP
jgi:hypothetical protein